MDYLEKTNAQFEQAIAECRALFEKKLHDYKASWRILRPTALTDQLFIKAKRIRSLEIKKESKVGEGIRPRFCRHRRHAQRSGDAALRPVCQGST